MTIRPANTADLPHLAEFWYDQMALLVQKTPAIRLAPDAIVQWKSYVEDLLGHHMSFVAEVEGELLGGIIGKEARNRVALLPERFGLIEYLVLDMHSPKRQQNTAGLLVNAMKETFRNQGLEHCHIRVAAQSPLELGFWRGMGAHLLEEGFWISL